MGTYTSEVVFQPDDTLSKSANALRHAGLPTKEGRVGRAEGTHPAASRRHFDGGSADATDAVVAVARACGGGAGDARPVGRDEPETELDPPAGAWLPVGGADAQPPFVVGAGLVGLGGDAVGIEECLDS